jgi:hypothetical protein
MSFLAFSDAKPLLAPVVHNGVAPTDLRVMTRANEAIFMALSVMIPVGGAATYTVQAAGTVVTLPPQLDNALDVEVLNQATVRGSQDTNQAFWNVLEQSTYADPATAQDNPMIDMGLVDVPSVGVCRRYNYPGLAPNATVSVTGKKRYIPITQDSDILIVQNIEALKLLILGMERNENNAPDLGAQYTKQGFELLQQEVKNFILDPSNSMRRKANYENDLTNFNQGSFGWTRARIALEVPGALRLGKISITRILERAEERLIEKGIYRGTLKTYTAEVTGGLIYFPKNVMTVVGLDLDGQPIDIRSILSQYQENGPGLFMRCHPALVDDGEEFFPATGNTRRKFHLKAVSSKDTHKISAICKLRWVRKNPTDQMVIKNYDALQLMCQAIVKERQEDWKNAEADRMAAIRVCDDELHEYLRGQKITPAIETYGFNVGEMAGSNL